MKKRFILLIAIVSITMSSYAQVKTGINTTDPKATLDIVASNTATPANTDGLLIPRLDVFPASNPTVDQHGMLIYITTIASGKEPGFYYWDNSTTSWVGNVISSPTHYVGELYGGGIVFTVDESGAHGLIASLDDVSGPGGAQVGTFILYLLKASILVQ